MQAKLEQKHKIIIGVQVISALALILFWGGFYLSDYIEALSIPFYLDYPDAVPLPDIVMVIIMLLSASLMAKLSRFGFILAGLVAFCLIALGIVGFDVQAANGDQLISMVSIVKVGYINLWCVVFGLYFILMLLNKARKKTR